MYGIVLGILFSFGVTIAQAQTVYRWTDADGNVHYSDQPPSADAKSVQQKRLGANIIETDSLSYATQVATKKYPVTLYVFDCGEPCTQARSLLRNRGIPVTELNPSSTTEISEKLRSLTGSLGVPVLQVGEIALVKGFNEESWNSALSQAGYPTSNSSRTNRPVAPNQALPSSSASASPAAQ